MDNQNNNVWIDRQEYDRLKALEAQPQPRPVVIASGSATGTTMQYSDAPAKSSVSKLTIATGVFAVFSFIFPPAILVFLGSGIASLVKFFRGKASGKTKVGVGLAVGLGIGALLIVAGPILLLSAVIIMFQIGCWTGLGSCTTG